MTDIGAGFRILGIYYIVGLATVTLPAGSTLCMCMRMYAVIPAKNTKMIPVFLCMHIILISILFMLNYFLFVCHNFVLISSSCNLLAYIVQLFACPFFLLFICFKDCPPYVKHRAFNIPPAKINIQMV